MKKSINDKLAIALRDPSLGIAWILNKAIFKPLRKVEGRRFDGLHNISTEGEVKNEKLNPLDNDSLKHATEYQATPIDQLDFIFKRLKSDSPENHFIDIGCGRGRACFYASQKYKTITGIDFSPDLIHSAKANLDTFNGGNTNITFAVQDARLYDLPDRRSTVFLFNPFDHHILRPFLDRSMRHFKKYHSRIVYVNDVCRNTILEYGFREEFRAVKTHGMSIYQMP
jgi:SAM-dependent methyltransferase